MDVSVKMIIPTIRLGRQGQHSHRVSVRSHLCLAVTIHTKYWIREQTTQSIFYADCCVLSDSKQEAVSWSGSHYEEAIPFIQIQRGQLIQAICYNWYCICCWQPAKLILILDIMGWSSWNVAGGLYWITLICKWYRGQGQAIHACTHGADSNIHKKIRKVADRGSGAPFLPEQKRIENGDIY